MSQETNDEPEVPVTIDELTEFGREKLARAETVTRDAVAVTTDYIKANPWIAVAGAAVLGGAIVALASPCRRQTNKLEAVRDWFDDAYAKLPSQADLKCPAIPKFLKNLGKSLHLTS